MEQKLLSKSETDSRKTVTPWGSLCWLAGRAFDNSDDMTVGRVTIKPGMCNPRHRHANCDEVLYLLEGTLEHALDDETVVLQTGDTLSVRRGTLHNAANVGNADADMIVIYSSPDRQMEHEE